MNTVPDQLDGATVLATAPATDDQVGIDYTDGTSIKIAYFAVAQYPNNGQRAYLFGVSTDHQVVSDFLYDSVEQAQSEAVRNGWVQPSTWRSQAR